MNKVKILEYAELDSTNDEAKRLIRSIDCCGKLVSYKDGVSSLFGTVVTAKKQNAGRGRMGRSFFSAGEDSIYISFILPPPADPAEQLITALAAVAVCEAIEKTTRYKPGIKWVNDILVDGKKVCGILAETVPGAVILGIGININIEEGCLPYDLRDTAGSLQMDEGERSRFEKTLIESVFRYSQAEGSEAASLMDKYRTRSVLLGKRIVFSVQNEYNAPGGDHEERTAIAKDIEDDGALIVEYEDGSIEALRSSIVSVRLIQTNKNT